MGQDITSPSAKDEPFNESIGKLEEDVIELEKINNKESLTIVEEIRLMMMCKRIKENLELVNSLRQSLVSTYNENRAVYYYACGLITRTNNAVVKFNNIH